MSNPAKIFCSPGAAIKTNQRRAKPRAGEPDETELTAAGIMFTRASPRQGSLSSAEQQPGVHAAPITCGHHSLAAERLIVAARRADRKRCAPHVYWVLHAKFAASFVLPEPLYVATCG